MPTGQMIEQWIAEGLECHLIKVVGDGHHWEALIVSDAFEGLRPIARHQRVYKVLGDRMKADIHALSMKTLTSDEYVTYLSQS